MLVPARLIIDGNNVMGSRPDGWWRDRAAATVRLLEQVAAWAAGADEAVVIVFDGRRPQGFEAPAAVDVRFAERPGRDAADDVIERLVADDPRPDRVTVVTSDARLAARVRAHGARVTGSRAFRDRLDGQSRSQPK
jgi:predicted RNA-binding protein with PIN domain